MPLYEYACRSCGTRFEEMRKVEQRLSAPACRACGADDTLLSLSAPGFVGAASGAPKSACSTDAGGCCGGGFCMN